MRCKGGAFRRKLRCSRCSSCIEGGRQIEFFPYLFIHHRRPSSWRPACIWRPWIRPRRCRCQRPQGCPVIPPVDRQLMQPPKGIPRCQVGRVVWVVGHQVCVGHACQPSDLGRDCQGEKVCNGFYTHHGKGASIGPSREGIAAHVVPQRTLLARMGCQEFFQKGCWVEHLHPAPTASSNPPGSLVPLP